MRALRIAGCLLLVCTGGASAQETPATSTIQSIGLFKNGLAVVRRNVTVPGAGIYRLEDVPNPVHGTFFIESAATVTATVTMREVEVAADNSAGQDLQRSLAGKAVTIHFRDGSIPSVTGTVASLARPADTPPAAAAPMIVAPYDSSRLSGGARFLVLQTPTGRSYVDSSMIAHVAIAGDTGVIRNRKPVLLLSVEGTRSERVHIAVLYLTSGLAWAPSYRVDLTRADRLSIEQQAIVKNELEDFADAELQLISGFPNVQFANVRSPLAVQSTWASFFQQLNRRMGPGTDSASVTRQVVMNVSAADDAPDLGALPTESVVDVHYHSIGRRTLSRGDAVALVVAKAEAAYERIVEWLVPDTRTPDGRAVVDYGNRQAATAFEEPPWDAIRFRNPLPFAMTTAPATITAGVAFNGQTMSTYVNTGQQTSLRVTTALSIRTRAVEHEVPNQPREAVRLGSRDYRRVSVQGELTAGNNRDHEVTLVIRRQFSGDLASADANPTVTLREEGVYSVNRRNELTWTIVLKPGETRTLSYVYSTLI